jgi:hypothetical protein
MQPPVFSSATEDEAMKELIARNTVGKAGTFSKNITAKTNWNDVVKDFENLGPKPVLFLR